VPVFAGADNLTEGGEASAQASRGSEDEGDQQDDDDDDQQCSNADIHAACLPQAVTSHSHDLAVGGHGIGGIRVSSTLSG
jgi:hypothetical protein